MAGGDVETAVEIFMTSQGKKGLSQDRKERSFFRGGDEPMTGVTGPEEIPMQQA